MVIIKDKLKVKILENNNEVLPLLIRDIGEDIVLVRFDAYADFLVPRNIQADEIQTLNNLVDSINNKCWIFPAVYRGYIKRIFWFKPPWAHEFLDGNYQLQVGKCQQTGQLKVASTLPYYTSNCVYSSIEKLSNIHTVDIYITTCGLAKNYSTIIEEATAPIYDNENDNDDNDNRKKAKLTGGDPNHKTSQSSTKRIDALNATLFNKLLENKQFLLDIDLSFFSTDDPIRKKFDENEYEILRYVYTRIVQENTDGEIQQYITARLSALEQIHTLMSEYLTDPKLDQPITIDNPYLSALIAVIRYKKLDWKPIHDYGAHLSDTRPPLHVSSEGMMLYLLEAMAKVLESVQKHPILITISRCVQDEYCSVEQADLIQLKLEKKLRKLYKIDEFMGKSLSKSADNDDDDEDEYHEEDHSDNKSLKKTNDDNNHHRLNVNTTNEDKASHSEVSSNKTIASKHESDYGKSSSISPSKMNLSPGEVKAISPSSLSETSPISN